MKRVTNYIKNSCFVKSFKELDKRLFIVMASELLLIISILIVFLLSNLFLKTSISTLGISDEFMEEINKNKGNETFAMDFIKGQMRYTSPDKFISFLSKLGFNILFSLLIITIIISLFKSYEWSKIERKKLTKKFFIRYLGLFLVWIISWSLLFFIIALGFKSSYIKYFVWAWLFFFLYFSLILYPIFVKEKKMLKTIKKAFKIGVKKIHKLILPIINIWILLQLGYLIILLKIPLLTPLLAVLYLLFYLSWIKFYMYKVIENV